jgi:HlyD family secretion protein
LRLGQRATFTVDAFPGQTFAGEIRQIRKAAQNVQNVVTYTVLVSANNDSGQLMPGMTANVRIVTDTRESALKVPNAALRFRPPGAAADGADKGGAVQGSVTPAPVAGGPGGGAQLRERLVTDLKLDEQQQARLDPILAESRNKFMALRDQPEESRARLGAAIRSETRARIEEILKPEQKERYAQIVAEQAGRTGAQTRGRVWVLDAGKPKAIDVRVGLTDGTATEISGEGIAEGVEVLIGATGGATSSAPAAKGAPPRMFF